MTLTDTRHFPIAQAWPPLPQLYDVAWVEPSGHQGRKIGLTREEVPSVVGWIVHAGCRVATEFSVVERTWGWPVVARGEFR